ncbi:MAG: 30S ribosomal protein S26e [Candidatus Heimdallarchaeota archaeon]|nr:MAG: 30S ribosomal protein S26e [Candidatus Heimdallarchaeota archaeon]
MGKKRKSGGRSKGGKGSLSKVHCSSCGRLVPRDKAKRKTSYKQLVDFSIGKELRQQGTHIARIPYVRYYCVSCAIHRHHVKIRSEDERKDG